MFQMLQACVKNNNVRRESLNLVQKCAERRKLVDVHFYLFVDQYLVFAAHSNRYKLHSQRSEFRAEQSPHTTTTP